MADEETVRVAVLERGDVYYLGDRRFDFGIPAKVNPEEEAHLTEYGIDRVSVHSGDEVDAETRQKFAFRDMDAEQYAEIDSRRRTGAGPTLLRGTATAGGDDGPRITGRARARPASA